MIAVNYPAREFGIGRHCTVTEAKKLCPNLIAQHVATWRAGDEKWAYHDDPASHIGSHKVSLDPYRLESRKILALIKQCLPAGMQKVEKASIDEVFIDLSAQVHSILLRRFPELTRLPPYDDATEKLPLPPITALDWQDDVLVGLDDAEAEISDPDWDDVALLIGSEIVRDIRAQIRRTLHYTCSAGIGSNKMLSKLGSGHKKPNQQTVIRNRAVQQFLSDMKFTKIRNLGGKLGEQVKTKFNTESIKDLLNIPLKQLKLKLGDDTAVWLYETIRGVESSEVTSRTQIKSMLSAKSFQPTISTIEQAVKWLRIFAADIFSRLVEEGVLENKRRPKTIQLHHRSADQTRSRSSGIPQGKSLEENILFDLAKHMMIQIVSEGGVWPCTNLSLSVSGFEDGIAGNMGISTFLLRGVSRNPPPDLPVHEPREKRRRLETSGIQHFFSKREIEAGKEREGGVDDIQLDYTQEDMKCSVSNSRGREVPITDYLCTRCNAGHGSAEALQSHNDWHMAKDLQEEERGKITFARATSAIPRAQKNVPLPSGKKPSKGGGGSGKGLEQGQSKLKFG